MHEIVFFFSDTLNVRRMLLESYSNSRGLSTVITNALLYSVVCGHCATVAYTVYAFTMGVYYLSSNCLFVFSDFFNVHGSCACVFV